MKSLHSMGLAVAALALIAPLSAHAETPAGWYVGTNANMSFQHRDDAKAAGTTNVIEYKDGWGISGYGGYAFGNGFREEGEVTYRHSSADTITGQNAGRAGGGLHNIATMANTLYDINTNTRVTPYVGAGIGLSVVGPDNLRTINGATLDDDRAAFAYQGIAGFAVALEGNWSFTADYRYFATPMVKVDADVPGDAKVKNSSHNLMMGIKYAFAKPAAPAPAPAPKMYVPTPAPTPMPPKAAAPVVAPVPQSYMVFFDFDKSVITPEARRVIEAAAADFKRGKFVQLVVTGHTDTMGTAAYNMRLSQRRAAAVKAAFIAQGIPVADISTRAAGKTELLVPTNDHVREVQNRRAEILFK